MVRTALATSLCCAVLLWSAAPAAAEPNGGVGLGLDSSLEFWSGAHGLGMASFAPPLVSGFRVPIDVSRRWQLEPNLHAGYRRRRTRQVNEQARGDRPESTVSIHRSTLIGAALDAKRLVLAGPNTRLHLGATGGFDYNASRFETLSSSQGPPTQRQRSYTLFVGPVFGAEYFLSANFSLGFEGKLVANWAWNDPPNGPRRRKYNTFALSQSGSVALRFYF